MMIKFTLKFFIPVLMLVSSSSFAGLITTDLAEGTYITHEGYDWTWASKVNVTNVVDGFTGNQILNTFEDAGSHAGWMEIVNTATDPDLERLFLELTLSLFTDVNGESIHSAAYWNSTYTDVDHGSFALRSGQKNDDAGSLTAYFETFYVRVTPSQVPEPSTIMIFAIALIALSSRKRAIN
jgi:hypothetical protein